MGRISHAEAMKQLSELHSTLEIKLSIWLRQPTKALIQEIEQAAIEHADFLSQIMGLFADPAKRAWRPSPGRPRKVNADAAT